MSADFGASTPGCEGCGCEGHRLGDWNLTCGGVVPDVLVAPKRNDGFAGAKPPEWTRWVLAALSYNADTDTLADVFRGSGAVAEALAQPELPTGGAA